MAEFNIHRDSKKGVVKERYKDLWPKFMPFLDKLEEKDHSFLENSRHFIELIFIHKGDINSIEKEFPFVSYGIEFIERAKILCRKKELTFQEKILDTIKDSIYKSRKITFLQAVVLFYMNDLLFLDSQGNLDEEEYTDLQEYFYELKASFEREYSNSEW